MAVVTIRHRELATPNRKRYERPTCSEAQVVASDGTILHRAEVTDLARQWCERNGHTVKP